MTHNLTDQEYLAMRRLTLSLIRALNRDTGFEAASDLLTLARRVLVPSQVEDLIDRLIIELDLFDLCTCCHRNLVDHTNFSSLGSPLCTSCFNTLAKKD